MCWRYLSVSPHKSWPEANQQLEAFASSYRMLEKKMRVLGSTPPTPLSLRNAMAHEESPSSPSSKAHKKGATQTTDSPSKPATAAATGAGESESEEEEEDYDEASDG